jgi:hypothetical protein
MAEQYANLYSTTLASSYTAGAGSISVASATGAPTSGTFSLTIRDASTKAVKLIFRVTSVSGTTFTGAAEGTDANASSGDLVDGTMITVASIAQMQADALGLDAITAPPTTSWTWENQSSSTVAAVGKQLQFLFTGGADDIKSYYRTAPATPYTLTVSFRWMRVNSGIGTDSPQVIFRDGTGKLNTLGLQPGNARVIASYWSAFGTYGADIAVNSTVGDLVTQSLGEYCAFRISDDGTNLKFYYQAARDVWILFATQGRTVHFGSGPTQIGIGARGSNGVYLNLFNWTLS